MDKMKQITWLGLRIEVHYEMDGNECLLKDVIPVTCDNIDLINKVVENGMDGIATLIEEEVAADYYDVPEDHDLDYKINVLRGNE